MYHDDSSPQDQAADATMTGLYRQLDDHDLPGDAPFDTAAGLHDLTGRIQLADQTASRIGPDEIEAKLRNTLREAVADAKRRAPRSDQADAVLRSDGLPYYRAIVAVDIERSTSRPNPIKGELRNKLYELFEAALRKAGIDSCHHDQFVDRGDGILALIHPVDQAPKVLLLNRVVPMLRQLLTEYNASLPQHSRLQRELRVRVVMHAGGVDYDANGCFGEALDVAFRLLDAARVKRMLREMADPLILVVSEDIYSSVVRHGYDGIDYETFHPLVRVQVAGRRYPGWIHLPGQAMRQTVTQLATYQRLD